MILSFPGGKNNAVRVYYTRIQGNGNGYAPQDLNLYGSDFPAGAYISSYYTLQDVKISGKGYFFWFSSDTIAAVTRRAECPP